MRPALRVAFLLTHVFPLAYTDEPGCEIELGCAECVPDNMPVVTSPADLGPGPALLPAGGELSLSCAPGKFLAYPLRASLVATCEGGRFRVRHDQLLRHLLDLGCQESVFEDVLHEVEHCGPPLQGRAYLMQGGRHLAALCFDPDRGVATWARGGSAPPQPPHAHRTSPLSLLGNFNHMFDAATRHQAQTLYSDDERLNGGLHQLLKHDRYSLGAQTLTAGRLLAPRYFRGQESQVADFVSNRFAGWRGVVEGNLRHVHRDVAALVGRARSLGVHAGTHGVVALRTGRARTDLYLKSERRFPVPRYVWTVLHDTHNRTAVALVVLNDPLVLISEVEEAVFCESVCDALPWLRELRTNRNYETPALGLVFCCRVHEFTNTVSEMPKAILQDVPKGNSGLLTGL